MELSPQKRVRLAADIHESLVPIQLTKPSLDDVKRISVADTVGSSIVQDTISARRIKLGIIDIEQDRLDETRRHSVEIQDSYKDTVMKSQESYETLGLAK